MKYQNGSSELLHYGIPGMKWGVRKEYEPKGRSTPAYRGKKDKVINYETESAKTKLTLAGTDTYDNYRQQLKEFKLPERSNFYMPDWIASKKFQNLPKNENKLSDDLEALKVNDPTSDKRRTTNCFQCTIAYEMRCRGYDVQSNTNFGGKNFEYLHAFDIKDSFRVKTTSKPFFDDYSVENIAKQCFNTVETQCLSYGEGARGAITMKFPLGTGHTMNWVVEDGEFKLIDAQGVETDGYKTFCKSTFDVEVFRLDNAELLPGSTDFIEPYKPKVDIQKKVSDLIKDIGENVSKFVSDGFNFVKNLFKKN